MNEKALLFGRRKALVGIVTTPAPEAPHAAGPAIVILNAGLLHRVGPNRIHVKMARSLAEEGFTVLRFDLSGIGDSRSREGTFSLADAVIEDIREALDAVQSMTGIDRFVLVGICSGADLALFAAIRERRVAGAAIIDGYHLSSRGYSTGRLLRKLLSAQSWLRLVSGRSRVWSVVGDALAGNRRTQSVEPAEQNAEYPSVAEYCEWLRAAAARGVTFLLVYTEDGPSFYHYRRSLRQQIPRWPARERFSVEYLDGSDHVFTLRASQDRILRVISRWVTTLPPDSTGSDTGPVGGSSPEPDAAAAPRGQAASAGRASAKSA